MDFYRQGPTDLISQMMTNHRSWHWVVCLNVKRDAGQADVFTHFLTLYMLLRDFWEMKGASQAWLLKITFLYNCNVKTADDNIFQKNIILFRL